MFQRLFQRRLFVAAIVTFATVGLSAIPLHADAFEAYAAPSVADTFDAFAPPNVWAQYPLKGHIGPACYQVTLRPVGKTVVVGQVEYYSASGQLVVQDFQGTVMFCVGNFVGQPKIRLKGVPFGSVVTVIH